MEGRRDADAAAEDGSIAEIIVIGVENTAARIYEYTPTTDPTTPGGGGGDQYLAALVTELKPQIDGMLRTLPDRAHTGILGSSLGGLISAYAGVKRPDVYGIVGAMSPSTWWNSDVIIGDVGTMPTTARPARVYVDSGDSGTGNDDVTETNMLASTYVNLGYTSGVDFLHVVQAGGQHNEVYWAAASPRLRYSSSSGRARPRRVMRHNVVSVARAGARRACARRAVVRRRVAVVRHARRSATGTRRWPTRRRGATYKGIHNYDKQAHRLLAGRGEEAHRLRATAGAIASPPSTRSRSRPTTPPTSRRCASTTSRRSSATRTCASGSAARASTPATPSTRSTSS